MNQTNCPSCQNHLSTVTSCVTTDATPEHISHALPEALWVKTISWEHNRRSLQQCCHFPCRHWTSIPYSLKQLSAPLIMSHSLQCPFCAAFFIIDELERTDWNWLACYFLQRVYFDWRCCRRLFLLIFMQHFMDGNRHFGISAGQAQLWLMALKSTAFHLDEPVPGSRFRGFWLTGMSYWDT